MKKITTIVISLILICTISGCSPGELLEKIIPVEKTDESSSSGEKARVYMDEISGTLMDFDGTYLTLKTAAEETLTLNVSQATLECEDGMITGDEISIIYEGQLTNDDTSSVKALKVVDEYHKKNHLEDRTIRGTLQNLTPNTITIKSEKGNLATYPITGTEQYYKNGLSTGQWIYLHFKGKFPPKDTPGTLNASHMKVLSISDIDPMKIAKKMRNPSSSKNSYFRASIMNIQLNTLSVRPKGSKNSVNINLTDIPCYFKGGIAPGSLIYVYYDGDFSEQAIDQISIKYIIGENTDNLKDSSVSSTITGTIIGSTANTITVKTTDEAIITCNIEHAVNQSTGGLLTGSSVCITFHPASSKTSNIYDALKIIDA